MNILGRSRRSRLRGNHCPLAKRGTPKSRRQAILRMGASAVEFAIVANVMFLIIMTCIEFARLNMVRNLAQDAAYYGARKAVVPGATPEEAEEVADNIMSSMLGGGYTIDVSDVDVASSEVTVTVGVALHDVALFVPLFLPDSTIETQAKMRTERYNGFYEQ